MVSNISIKHALRVIIGCNNFKSINWFEGNLEDACATTDGKIIMIDFYTDWWFACKLLDANTFTDSDVIAYLKDNFISLKIDGETKYGSQLFNEYKGSGYPLLLFLDSNKNEIDRFYGSYDASAFLKKLKNIKNGENTLPSLQAEYKKGNHSVENLSQLAEKYSERGNDSLATSFHNQILRSKNLPINLFYKSKLYLSVQAL